MSHKERLWLDKKQAVKYAYDPNWKPLSWRDEIGNHRGIIADLIELIGNKSGIKFQAVQSNSWRDALNTVKAKKIDMFSGVGETKETKKYLNFTNDTLFSIVYVLVSRDGENYLDGIKSLKGKNIGVLAYSTIEKLMRKNYPNIKTISIATPKQGYENLLNHKIDIFIVNGASAQYYLNHYKDLKIAYKTNMKLDLKIAFHKDVPKEILSIINKTIPLITKKERDDIVYKYVNVTIEKTVNWKIIGIVISISLLIILLFVLLNLRLKNLINKKTMDLENLTETLEAKVKQQTRDLTKQLRIVKMAERKQDELLVELKKSKLKTETMHKHTRDSINYASLIQGAVISQESEIKPFFKDSFVYWMPKDTVGGDIWLFNELRHKDECLLFVIDCTGHGVPGAFVTMIVKAIEREIIANLKKHPEFDISPAIIMAHFNKTMKELLKQETTDSLSNAGFDGGIIYYNRRTQIVKFAGAETPLFYITTDGKFTTIKGDRYSVGYKKCSIDYEYKETVIEVEEGMKFYCTTDGYLDQNGGAKDFPFGKRRFGNIIKENYTLPMERQKEIFINEITRYESQVINNDRNDDMTLIAFEIGEKSDFKEETIDEIVKYEGIITQNVIASCMDNIEEKITNINFIGVISTITIEYCQNIMNYSKDEDIGSKEIAPRGTIEVQYINREYYDVIATNIVSREDKEKIEPKLIEIQGLDKAGIKKRYRELRRSGQNTHEKGGGIGMYEIASVSDSIEYSFEAFNEDKYRFTMKSIVKRREKKV